MPENQVIRRKLLVTRLLSRLVSIPSLFICLLAMAYFGVRIVLSSHHVAESVRARLVHALNCDVSLSRASLSPMGALAIENLSLTYRKADGLHEVFKADLVQAEFEPLSLLESRLRLTSLRFSGAAMAFERDSEGWLTIGRIIRPLGKQPALTLTVEARDSLLRFGDGCIPVEFLSGEVSRLGDRVDVFVTDSSLLGGGLEGSGYVLLEEDPLIHAEFKFHGVSLARLFGEIKDPVFDVQGEASSEIAIHGRSSSANLIATGSRLGVKDFALTSSWLKSRDDVPPVLAAKRIELSATAALAPGKPMCFTLTLDEPEISVREAIDCRNRLELIPAAQRAGAVMGGLEQVEVLISGNSAKIVDPVLSGRAERFEGRLTKSGDNVSLRDFKAQLWGGVVEAKASLYRAQTNWLGEGRMDVKNVNLQQAVAKDAGETPAWVRSSGLAGWLSADFSFRLQSQADPPFTGTGNLAVRRAQMWGIPCFARVAAHVKLPAETASVQQEFRCGFAADRDRVTLSRLELTNERVKLFGKGQAYYSGEIDLDLGVNVLPSKAEGGEGLIRLFEPTERHRLSVSGEFGAPEVGTGERKP